MDGDYSAHLGGPIDTNIYYNLIYNNDWGVHLESDAVNTTIYGNTIANNSCACLLVGKSDSYDPNDETYNVSFKNNICYKNGENLSTGYSLCTSELAIRPDAYNRSISSDYNLYTLLPTSNFSLWNNSVFSNISSFQTATSEDAHSIVQDPSFINASSENFMLNSSSPAIDAGINLGLIYANGLDTNSTWPNNVSLLDQNSYGSGWEIGAYVYNGTGDTTAPTVTLPTYTNATKYQNTQSLTFNISAIDSGVGIDSCVINVVGNANQTVAVSSSWCNGTYALTGIADGNKTINAYANDTSGNMALNNSYVVWLDTTAPTITSPANATIAYLSSLFSDFNAADSGIGVDNSTWNVNDTTYFQINSTGGLTNKTVLAAGVYILNITIKDLLGNGNYTMYKATVNQNSGNCHVLLNETSPVTYPVSPKVYTDCTTGYALYRNGTGITNNTQAALSAGTYNFTVIRTDTANYSNIYNETTFQINKKTPNASLTNDKNWTREYDGTNNTIGISENNSGDSDVTYTLFRNNTNKTTSDSIGAVGVYSYKINTTGGTNYSSADNMNATTLTIQDSTKPLVSVIYPGNVSYNSTQTQLNYSASDLLLSSCWCTTNGGTINSSPNSLCTNFTGLSSSEGSNTWTVWANDSSNNKNHSTVIFIHDTTAPTITLPVYANLTGGQNTSTLTLSVSVLDSASGLAGSACLINANGTNITVEVSNGWCNSTSIPLQELAIGNYTINIYANDTVNNLGLNNSYYVQIVSTDVTPPTMTLNTPADNYNTTSQTIALNATASENVNLTNMSIYGNWTGNWTLNATNSSPMNNVLTTFIISNLPEGKYSWNVRACDNSSNCAFAISNQTFTIDKTPPYFTAIENQTVALNTPLTYDINATDDIVGLGNFSINDTGNFSMDPSTGIVTNATALSSGYYLLNVTVNDTLGNLNWSLWNVNVSFDNENPGVSINAPSAGTTLSTNNITINISFSDNIALSSCSYNITNSTGTVIADTAMTCELNSFEYKTISDGSNYVLTTFANDTSGNANITNRTFSIDTSTPTTQHPGGGGSSGGGGYPLYVINKTQLDNGYHIGLYLNWGLTFQIGNESHSLIVKQIMNGSIVITISSIPQNITLAEGESKNVDVNGDSSYDVFIALNSLINGKADITIKTMTGAVSQNATQGNQSTGGNQSGTGQGTGKIKISSSTLYIGIIALLALLIIFVCYRLVKRIVKEHRQNISEQPRFGNI